MEDIIVPYKISLRDFYEAHGINPYFLIPIIIFLGVCYSITKFIPETGFMSIYVIILLISSALFLIILVIFGMLYYLQYYRYGDSLIILNKRGVFFESPYGASRIAWEEFTSCRSSRNVLYLKNNADTGIILNKDALLAQGVYYELQKILKEKGIFTLRPMD